MKVKRLTVFNSAGFGLIELMVALVLGLVILLGVTQIATQNSATRNEIERTASQIQNATFALSVIENDIANAGFWGERGEVTPGTTPPICPVDNTRLEESMGYPIQGGRGVVDCDFNTGPDTITAKAATDYLALRRASSCVLGSTGCEPAQTGAGLGNNFHLQVHACFIQSSPDKPADSYLIATDVSTSVLRFLERDCVTPAPIYRFINRIYYLNDDDELMRAELEGNKYKEQELVENVELMRFEYGLDGDRDGQIDNFASSVSDPNDPVWGDVAMVRVGLIVRNSQPTSGYSDERIYNFAGQNYTVPSDLKGFRRQLYIRTIGTPNIAGRRESP
jgi:type IV pilus assembly protein PilW